MRYSTLQFSLSRERQLVFSRTLRARHGPSVHLDVLYTDACNRRHYVA